MNPIGFELTKHDVIYFRFENEPDLCISKQQFIEKAEVQFTKAELKREVEKEMKIRKEPVKKKVELICRDRIIKRKQVEVGTLIYNEYISIIKESIQKWLKMSI